MNAKAQAGLEYLMTYGWALILIATVIGVMVFVTGTPANETLCNVDDPTSFQIREVGEFRVKGYTLNGSRGDNVNWASDLKLQNASGEKMTIEGLVYSIGSGYGTYTQDSQETKAYWESPAGCEYNLWFMVQELNSRNLGLDPISASDPEEVGAGGEIWFKGLELFYEWDPDAGQSSGCAFDYGHMKSNMGEVVVIEVDYRGQTGVERQANISCKSLPTAGSWPA